MGQAEGQEKRQAGEGAAVKIFPRAATFSGDGASKRQKEEMR